MTNLPFILPTGTQIVSHIDITNSAGEVTFAAGAVGIIVKSPVDAIHAYRVRFIDGTEQALKREQFSVRSHHQRPITPDEHLAGVDLYAHVVYRCVVGSRAYGPTMTSPTLICAASICRLPIYTGRYSASRSSWSAVRKPTGRYRNSSCWP